ncbi:MAG TPA: short-chain fatty acid transporter [Holosporales bacterium]|nr:short-chain fatty acid transporter [Holosporales bacterium]
MIKTVASFFDNLMRKYTPDPFILALFLSAVVFGLGYTLTPSSMGNMLVYWGDGFWSLMPFTMQMAMVFVGGYILATTPIVSSLLKKVAKKISSPHQAVFVVSLISCAGCLVNWGFGLVIASLLCREIIKVVPQANFRLMVASAYGGFLLFHGGLSASIPLIVATPGNFSEALIGGLIPIQDTLLSPLNLFLSWTLLILMPTVNWYVSRSEGMQKTKYKITDEEDFIADPDEIEHRGPAEKLELSRSIGLIAGGIGLLYVGIKIAHGTFSLELNNVCFLLLFLALFLHKNIRVFLGAVNDAAKRVGPILLQFPFYAGITGILKGSNLASVIAQFFAKAATPETFDIISFYVAGFLTLFVPSGGGLWVIEAPIVIEAAKALGTSIPKACMAVAWGDAWTHMIQPFWALPVLAIAGLKLRDIMGYCVIMLLVSGVVISAAFLIF